MKRLMPAVLALVVAPALALAATQTYEIDPAHSSATFSVKHLMVANVKGEFGNVKGTVNLDEKDLSKSSTQATIDATTINTREPKRDAHLKSPDFFDVEKYPTITFQSKSWKKAGKDKLKVVGDLTMHGVTKEVTLNVDGPSAEVKDPYGNIKRAATATTKLNRKDFGLNWNQNLERGGVLVGDEVQVTLDLELLKKPAPSPAQAKDPTK